MSSLAEDREMAGIYAEAGVDEYWIINATERCIEIHRQPREGRYRETGTRRPGEMCPCHALTGLSVDVAQLFADLRLEQNIS